VNTNSQRHCISINVCFWAIWTPREKSEGCIGSATYSIWISLPEGLMKLNVDVAIAKGSIEIVFAAICKIDKELVRGSSTLMIMDYRTRSWYV
jgi:hypothetical protein